MHEAGVGCMEGMLVIEGSKKRNMKGQLELPLSTINKSIISSGCLRLFPTLPSCNNKKSVLSRSSNPATLQSATIVAQSGKAMAHDAKIQASAW